MRERPTDEIMQERREERLKRLCAFMLDARLRPLNMGREAAHNLLTGWFENSQWRTAWWCVKQASGNSWTDLRFTIEIMYLKHVLRWSESRIEQRFLGDV